MIQNDVSDEAHNKSSSSDLTVVDSGFTISTIWDIYVFSMAI